MIVLWVTLFVLHRGYSLVPVITVQLGEPVTITCVLPGKSLGSEALYWYKQSAGDTLKLIVTFVRMTTPQHGPEFSKRMQVKIDKNLSNLTILRTITEDEGMYHCGVSEWIKTEWSVTYLSVKGNNQRTSNYTVVQRSTVSDPVRPGDSVTLQCSVLSDSDNKTCPGDHSVYWFRAGSDKSHSHIIYTDGNDKCEKRSDSLKSCVYSFSKTISSSDAGTHYCAVATCGQILFGNGTNLDVEGTIMCSHTTSVVIYLLCAALALCLFVIVFLIHAVRCDCCNAADALQRNSGGQKSQQREEFRWVYSAIIFTVMKTVKNGKAAETEKIYAAAKAFGLN